MSDEKTKAGDGVRWEHYCCIPECKKWGGFGYARTAADPVNGVAQSIIPTGVCISSPDLSGQSTIRPTSENVGFRS